MKCPWQSLPIPDAPNRYSTRWRKKGVLAQSFHWFARDTWNLTWRSASNATMFAMLSSPAAIAAVSPVIGKGIIQTVIKRCLSPFPVAMSVPASVPRRKAPPRSWNVQSWWSFAMTFASILIPGSAGIRRNVVKPRWWCAATVAGRRVRFPATSRRTVRRISSVASLAPERWVAPWLILWGAWTWMHARHTLQNDPKLPFKPVVNMMIG